MPPEVMQVLGWFPLMLILSITLVCFIHLRLSKRMWLLLVGFLGLAAADIAAKAIDAMIRAQKIAFPDVGPAFTALYVVRILCWGIILFGMVSVFADLRERVDIPPRDDSTGYQPPWKKE